MLSHRLNMSKPFLSKSGYLNRLQVRLLTAKAFGKEVHDNFVATWWHALVAMAGLHRHRFVMCSCTVLEYTITSSRYTIYRNWLMPTTISIKTDFASRLLQYTGWPRRDPVLPSRRETRQQVREDSSRSVTGVRVGHSGRPARGVRGGCASYHI